MEELLVDEATRLATHTLKAPEVGDLRQAHRVSGPQQR